MRLKNRIAIVTGAAGGIGEAVAHLFAQHGAGVMVADLNIVGVSAVSYTHLTLPTIYSV